MDLNIRWFVFLLCFSSIFFTGQVNAELVGEIDPLVIKQFPLEFTKLANHYTPLDSSGLLGRNRQWGEMYSPRFQYGAGKALRIALVLGNIQQARQIFSAIVAGSASVQRSGEMISRLPPRVSQGHRLSSGDKLSAVAFYLGDACLALSVLKDQRYPQRVAARDDRIALTNTLRRATRRLVKMRKSLMEYDSQAPNRLLFDALAFQACGGFVKDELSLQIAPMFVDAALELLHKKGYFIEAGGWDTSYQAVAINVGKEVVLSGYNAPELKKALIKAAHWLESRVDKQGRVNSSGNSRTCSGGESFLGKPKKLSISDVFQALAYLGEMGSDRQLMFAAVRVSNWYQSHPGENTC